MATRDEDIDLESGECVPVGHIWKFDLEQRKRHDFGVKWTFIKKKMELSMSCSCFSRQLQITETKIRRAELQSRESS